ncbi:thiol:disulfide interchange protein DsbA/DsbL [Lamprobacter modestohalophilus]|nr:thiol:disulfide interchange protein DsbA/DsbL [Lamprobacter modestohalophilus]
MRRSPLPFRVLALFFALTAAPTASSEDQRQRYATLSDPQTMGADNAVEVIQVFWYGCPSCGQLEDQLKPLIDETHGQASFRRMPAVAPRWEPHARAYYAAESLGALEPFHQALARAMQDEHRPIMTETDLINFAREIGINADAFRAAYHSPEVEHQVQQAIALTERFEIASVPALIINGRYRTDLQLAGTQEAMIEVSRALIEDATAPQSRRGRRGQRQSSPVMPHDPRPWTHDRPPPSGAQTRVSAGLRLTTSGSSTASLSDNWRETDAT